MVDQSSEEDKLEWLLSEWSDDGVNSEVGACLQFVAPFMQLKVDGDAATPLTLAAFVANKECSRFASEFVLPVFEVWSRYRS